MRKNSLSLLALLIGSLLSACSSAPAPQADKQSLPQINSLELFLSRAHLAGTEFEQYKLDSGTLFSECGDIRRGRFMPLEHAVMDVQSDTLSELNQLAQPLATESARQDLSAAGDNSWLADPGQFQLRLTTSSGIFTWKTSLDSISSPTSAAEHKLMKLASALRLVSESTHCGNKSFFGLK